MLSLDQWPFDQSMCAQGLWPCTKALALLHLPLWASCCCGPGLSWAWDSGIVSGSLSPTGRGSVCALCPPSASSCSWFVSVGEPAAQVQPDTPFWSGFVLVPHPLSVCCPPGPPCPSPWNEGKTATPWAAPPSPSALRWHEQVVVSMLTY